MYISIIYIVLIAVRSIQKDKALDANIFFLN